MLVCRVCKNKFKVKPYRKNKAKYCSYECYWQDKKGTKPWNTGKKLSMEHRQKLSKVHLGIKLSLKTRLKMKEFANSPERKALQSKIGKASAKKRWENHKPKYKYKKTKGLWTCSKDPKIQLEKKRFRNQRYKARKRNALGSHTYEEWIAIKEYYGNMCLCCKRCEPEVKLTEDHIIPLSKGGSDYIDNIQPLCVSCNTRKHTEIIYYGKQKGGEKFNFLN